jgi:hypothetical protein
MRGDPHGTWRLPHDLGNGGRVQPGHHAQHDDLSLVCWQRGDRGQDSSRGELLQHDVSSVWRDIRGVGLAQPLQQRSAARSGATQVDRAVPGDREQPRPECPLLAAESGQAGNHLEPGIARDVIGGIRSGHLEVPQQRWLDVTEYGRERRLVTSLRVSEYYLECGAKHRPSMCPASRPAQPEPYLRGRASGSQRMQGQQRDVQ